MSKKVKNRRDWQLHDIAIRDCYFKWLKEKKRIPTYMEIAKELNISYNTVSRHIESRDFQDLCKQFKPLTSRVMLKHFSEIESKGNPQLIKTWYEVVENHSASVKVEHTINQEEAKKKVLMLFPPNKKDD